MNFDDTAGSECLRMYDIYEYGEGKPNGSLMGKIRIVGGKIKGFGITPDNNNFIFCWHRK